MTEHDDKAHSLTAAQAEEIRAQLQRADEAADNEHAALQKALRLAGFKLDPAGGTTAVWRRGSERYCQEAALAVIEAEVKRRTKR